MNKKIVSSFLAVGASLLLLAGCGSQPAASSSAAASSSSAAAGEKVELHVSAAASLTDVMKELAENYKKDHPNVEIKFNFGSSGALQQAIQNGGDADLFFSAAQKQMNALEKAGDLAADTRRDLLINEVVLIVPKDGGQIASFDEITSDKVKKIALGEPKGVPVGQYSEEVFTNMNILDQVKAKAVYGSDVRQVLAWVENGEADCGIVYATDAAISQKVKIVAKAPDGTHKPIIYPVAILKDSKHKEAAAEFLKFAASPESASLFQKYGFEVK